jgi:hypothetical protein
MHSVWLPFLTRFEDMHSLFVRDQKNGVYLQWKICRKEKLLIMQDKTTTVSHIFYKWCGAYWEAGCYKLTAHDKENRISWRRHAFYATVSVTVAKVQHLRHTHSKAFIVQAECQFRYLRNTMKRGEKKWIIFSLQDPFILCSAWSIFLEMNLIMIPLLKYNSCNVGTEVWGGSMALCFYHSATDHLCHF